MYQGETLFNISLAPYQLCCSSCSLTIWEPREKATLQKKNLVNQEEEKALQPICHFYSILIRAVNNDALKKPAIFKNINFVENQSQIELNEPPAQSQMRAYSAC